jgi:hypothetical protein
VLTRRGEAVGIDRLCAHGELTDALLLAAHAVGVPRAEAERIIRSALRAVAA